MTPHAGSIGAWGRSTASIVLGDAGDAAASACTDPCGPTGGAFAVVKAGERGMVRRAPPLPHWRAPCSTLIMPLSGPPFNAEVIAETAQIHEQAGFDRVLIGSSSQAPDGFLIGAHAAAVTRRLQFLLAHRPGFVAPTVAARKLATLDHLSGGRTAVHLITGGNDAEQAHDGNFTDHDARYRRTQEYVTLLQRTWTAPAPFDHPGREDVRNIVIHHTSSDTGVVGMRTTGSRDLTVSLDDLSEEVVGCCDPLRH
jgi:hypothetical protein